MSSKEPCLHVLEIQRRSVSVDYVENEIVFLVDNPSSLFGNAFVNSKQAF